jgi:hypothetical protein
MKTESARSWTDMARETAEQERLTRIKAAARATAIQALDTGLDMVMSDGFERADDETDDQAAGRLLEALQALMNE